MAAQGKTEGGQHQRFPLGRHVWEASKMLAAHGGPRENRRRSTPKISRAWPRARGFRIGSTTAGGNETWSTWALPTIRQNSRWKASGGGGNWTGEKHIRRRGDC